MKTIGWIIKEVYLDIVRQFRYRKYQPMFVTGWHVNSIIGRR